MSASSKSKAFLASSCVFTAGMIFWVQWSQVKERRDRRVTVERDLEALEERRRMNLQDLKEQQSLDVELRRLRNENN